MGKVEKFVVKYWYVLLSVVTVGIWIVNLQAQALKNAENIKEIKQIIRVDLRQTIDDLERINLDLVKTVYHLEGCVNGKNK